MAAQRNRLIPIEWDGRIVDILSDIAPDDVEGAKVWWERYAPVLYAAMMDTLAVADSSAPTDDAELRLWLTDYIEKADLNPAQREWKKAGLLLIFLGGRYYTIKGLRTKDAALVVNRSLNTSSFGIQSLCEQLRVGALGLRDWQMQMKTNIVSSQISASIAAAGGADNFTPDIMATTKEHIAFQLGHLNNFAAAIGGGMKLDGTICRLMKMYINSARGAFWAVDGIVKANLGYTLYANVLGAGEKHCTSGITCASVTAQGYRPVGSLTPIGARGCMSNCLCGWSYLDPVTGNTW